jgi:putative spermidine/putrescine transport system substrate-binding protein
MKIDRPQSKVTRRRLLAGGTATLLTPFAPNLASPALAQSRTLNVASYGGAYGDALRKAWLEPFEKDTGIKVNLGVNASLSLAKLQVMSSSPEWDIVDLTGSEYAVAARENILLPLDRRVDTSKIFPEYVKSHGFGYALYVWGIGWDRRKIKDEEAPKNWAEFWDTKRFPGKRTLQIVKTNGNSLEAALFADGVTMDKMYPLDTERALKSLEKLGKDNIVWASTNQQPVENLTSGETPLAGIFAGRAIMANRSGADIGYTLNQAVINGDYLSVIRNSKNASAAFELLNYIATRGDRAAIFSASTSYAVPQMEVGQLLPATASDVKKALPTNPELKGQVLVVNEDWWSSNIERVAKRVREWQIQ